MAIELPHKPEPGWIVVVNAAAMQHVHVVLQHISDPVVFPVGLLQFFRFAYLVRCILGYCGVTPSYDAIHTAPS